MCTNVWILYILLTSSIETVEVAGTLLKTLLAMKTGSEFAAEYKAKLGEMEFLFHYLHPFRASKKKVSTVVGLFE